MNSKRITFLILLAASSLLLVKGVYAVAPKGTHDSVNNNSCSTTGWAYDPDSSSSSISVDIYRDGGAGSGVSLGRFTANVSRPDVNAAFGISGNHGFNVSLSSKLSDGKSHSLYVYAIDSSGTGTNPLISNSPKTIQCAAPAPTLTVSVNPASIILGESVTFSWSSTNATSCTGSRGGSYATSSSFVDKPPSLPYTYGMTCTGPGGSSGLKSATVTQKAVPAPEVFLNTDKPTITSGDSIKLSWSVRNTPTYCWASESWSGSKTIPANSAWASEALVPSGTGTKRFSFTCSNSAGQSNTASVDVIVNQKPVEPTPGVPVPLNVPGGNDGPISKLSGQSVTLYWGVANVTSWSITGPGFSKSGNAVGATPEYGNSTSFIPPAPPSGTNNKFQHFYKITGVGSEVIDSVLVEVRNALCNDGLDNDGDELIDFPADPGCSSLSDDDESNAALPPIPKPQCNDGIDNDSDGLIDFPADPGCSSANDDDETDAPPVITLFKAFNTIINIPELIPGGPPTCDIDAAPKLLIIPRNTSTLTWSCDKIINGCTLHDDNPKVPDIGAVASTSSQETPVINTTTTFTLQCPGADDKSVKVMLFTPFLKEIIPQ